MKYNVIMGIAFAATMFLIPLLALGRGTSVMQQISIKPANVQEESQNDAVIPNVSSQPEPPAAVMNDDGFRLLDKTTGKVFEVTARDYVRGALAAEMPPTFHPEALKAQAVAAHTYALQLKKQNQDKGEDKADADFTVDPQNWKSYTTEKLFRERYGTLADTYWQSIQAAADEVAGYVLTYEDEPIVAAYHSMSSGFTEDASNVWTGGKPYLMPVESRGDTLAPDYETEETFPIQTVADALHAVYPEIVLSDTPADWFHVETRSEGGYVTALTAGDVTMRGTELRSLLDLRSANFSVTADSAAFTFTVKGYGHGVGLSQYGADYLARQGQAFDEILLHYYAGAELARVTMDAEDTGK